MDNLLYLIKQNKNNRLLILGTTCSGKSTLAEKIENTLDMDKLVFPFLSQNDKEYVCRKPWTEEIGRYMAKLVNERIKIVKGKPLFGTVLLDSDFIIYLSINDQLLKERCGKRSVNFIDAKNMQGYIKKSIMNSGISYTEINI